MRRLREVLVIGLAEIGLAHPLVARDLVGGAAGQHRALRHDRDVVGDLEYHLHVVLDDDDIDARGELPDFRHRAPGFRRAHAADRLIEQQQPRLLGKRDADLEKRNVAVRESARLALRKRAQADLFEHALDFLAGAAILRRRAQRMQKAIARVRGDPDIFLHRQPVEHALDLQGARDAETADLVRLEAADVASRGEHAARVRGEKSAHQIEQRRFSGAVRTDDRVQPARCQRQADIVDSDQAAEALGESLDLQDRLAHGRWTTRSTMSRHRPTMPRGAKMTIRIATTPTIRPWCSQRVETTSRTTMNRLVPISGPSSVPAPPTMVQTTASPDTW